MQLDSLSRDVTVVLTSSDRHDLLERTLDSFCKWNTCANVKEIIVIEDSPHSPATLLKKYAKFYPVRCIKNVTRLGQPLSIDIAYSHVKTDYIFHCEDDWEFYAPQFIEQSFRILEFSPTILQVHLQALSNIGYEYTLHERGDFAILHYEYLHIWHGFSLNPGLRRLRDYKRLVNYCMHLATPYFSGSFEAYISNIYRGLGYVAAISLGNGGKGFVRHIGDGAHVV